MLSLLLGLSAFAAPIALCSQLPSFDTAGEHGLTIADLERDGRWWATVGRRVYFAPAPGTGLSEHVSDYAYAVGSRSALPAALLQRRVGGTGRLHIFHLPEGRSQLLQVNQAASGSRRSSFSQLQLVTHGMQLSEFDAYRLHDPNYANPLEKSGHVHLEERAVEQLTPDGIMAYLTRITTLPDAQHPTRSATNREATKAVQHFLSQEFQSMKYATCAHEVHIEGRDLANVIAFIPGASGFDTVYVGAHYDSIPQAGAAPGAEDNGSGLAVLLAMAQALAKMRQQPQANVYFVAFAGEEAGLLGSEAFAREIVSRSGKLPAECRPRSASFLRRGGENSGKRQAIIMDEVGWLSDKLPKPTVNLESYDWTAEEMDHLASSSWQHNGKALDVVHSSNPFGSDHMSFLRHNVSAVLTINGDDEAYPDYHSSEDKISNVNATFMHQIAKMNMGALMRMAGVQTATSH